MPSNAPLAQSAERLHGKEKVNGSIPLGGSVLDPGHWDSELYNCGLYNPEPQGSYLTGMGYLVHCLQYMAT